MGIKETIVRGISQLILERPAAGKTYDQLAESLQRTGADIERRAAGGKNSARAQEVMRHITGIERWSQNRLRVFLGEPYVRDEYNDYRPGKGLDLGGQIAAFRDTRKETIALARRLQAANLRADATVEHNNFGPVSARGWLFYMATHANRESKRIK